ncbi:uncharacterized protein LOC129073877 [Pteronotus mesoamericanus]|uniref:uncharacterized protein LOC129073877 n=1 Tax=Pteronotus mesoamericanus TaxID=1884717 RepID=UPI0023EB2F31|nr:uncharacterized protein LOC129073877 [Pteronotus parnellii mesoamericanus]
MSRDSGSRPLPNAEPLLAVGAAPAGARRCGAARTRSLARFARRTRLLEKKAHSERSSGSCPPEGGVATSSASGGRGGQLRSRPSRIHGSVRSQSEARGSARALPGALAAQAAPDSSQKASWAVSGVGRRRVTAVQNFAIVFNASALRITAHSGTERLQLRVTGARPRPRQPTGYGVGRFSSCPVASARGRPSPGTCQLPSEARPAGRAVSLPLTRAHPSETPRCLCKARAAESLAALARGLCSSHPACWGLAHSLLLGLWRTSLNQAGCSVSFGSQGTHTLPLWLALPGLSLSPDGTS